MATEYRNGLDIYEIIPGYEECPNEDKYHLFIYVKLNGTLLCECYSNKSAYIIVHALIKTDYGKLVNQYSAFDKFLKLGV